MNSVCSAKADIWGTFSDIHQIKYIKDPSENFHTSHASCETNVYQRMCYLK